MRLFSKEKTISVGETLRVELFTDAVMAIISTLLILEIHVPELADSSFRGVTDALTDIAPSLLAFAFSYLTLAVFWVNHHHFFHELRKADWKLLWLNNHLLFWLALVPFTTGFLAAYPTVPAVATVYCFVLFMAALAFLMLVYHGLFHNDLLDPHIGMNERKAHFRHSVFGVALYALATVLAPVALPVAAVLMIFIPAYYIVPRLMHDHEAME